MMANREMAAQETHPLAEIDRAVHAPARLMVIQLTADGRSAFRAYKEQMQAVLNDLPD
jgi:hypothetical protein